MTAYPRKLAFIVTAVKTADIIKVFYLPTDAQ